VGHWIPSKAAQILTYAQEWGLTLIGALSSLPASLIVDRKRYNRIVY